MVAMSGGVDSSVAALLLRDAGFDAVGVTLRLFDNDVPAAGAESACCSLSDVEDARQVALDLGIEHFTFNFTGVFGREVIDRFCEAYLQGRTPNPCIDCNRHVKFAALQERRRQLGFDYVAFIERRLAGGEGSAQAEPPAAFEPGPIMDEDGRVLGRHRGLVHYTVGQRKGIGVAAPEPLYVVAKDMAANALVVGPRQALEVREVRAGDVNLIAVEVIEAPLHVTAKTHYRHADAPGWAECEDGVLHVEFDEPLARPAAGQSLVLYDGERVVGGGTIL